VRASIIARCDAPPVFEPAKHDFYFVPLLVEGFAKISGRAAALTWRDAGLDALGVQGLTKFIAVIAFVADQRLCTFRQCRINQFGADVVAGLPCGQSHDQGTALSINKCMQL
jgi:hypothetical protein